MKRTLRAVLLLGIAFYFFAFGGVFGALSLEPIATINKAFAFFFKDDLKGKSPRQKIENALDIYPHNQVYDSENVPDAPDIYREMSNPGSRDRRSKPVVFVDESKRTPGYTVISAVLDAETLTHGVLLLNESGEIVHIWPADQVFSEAPSPPKLPHSVQVFKDGSSIVANDWGKLHARINPCGEPIWTTPMGTHHSI